MQEIDIKEMRLYTEKTNTPKNTENKRKVTILEKVNTFFFFFSKEHFVSLDVYNFIDSAKLLLEIILSFIVVSSTSKNLS